MKLSEAIRLGSMLHPQGFGTMFQYSKVTGELSTCALGAALKAAGDGHSGLRDLFPFAARRAACPVPRCHAGVRGDIPVANIVTHLNDNHHWTRERIADWVESIETKEQPVSDSNCLQFPIDTESESLVSKYWKQLVDELRGYNGIDKQGRAAWRSSGLCISGKTVRSRPWPPKYRHTVREEAVHS